MKRLCLLFVLLLMVGLQAIAQTTHTVSGKVLDEHGQGYPGAGVSVKGTVLGTVTDANGDFMLEVPDGSNILIIQAIGYTTRQVNDEGQAIVVRLQAVSKQLDGAVVTAMAIKREKREVGYNTTTLSSEDLTAGSNSSAISALQGKVAGANITSSTGGPGGSTRIVLRGEKSILKDNNALIVVDGVITNNFDRTQSNLANASTAFSDLTQVDFGNSANDLDPDEIESVTVLNGAAASALYGALGANGAVMYTTKKGKHSVSNKPSKIDVTVKTTYMQSDVLKYADLQHEYGQGNIYNGVPDDRRENFSWGYRFDDQLRPWGQVIDGKQLVKPYSDLPNNVKSFFNHGKDLNNFVSISGGTESSTYYLSLNSLNSTGVVPNTFYNKYSVRFNGATQLSNHFYSAINMNYINNYSRAEASGQGSGSVLSNLQQIARDIPIWELSNYDNKYYSMTYYDTAGIQRYGQYGAYYKNPYWVAKYYDNRNRTDRVLGDVKLGYKKGKFDVYDRVGVDVSADRSEYKTPMFNSQPVDPFYAGLPFVSAGGYTSSNYNGLRFYNDLIGTFTTDLSENFGMTAILGHNVTMWHDETLAGVIDPGTNGLVQPFFYNLSNNIGPVTGYSHIVNRRTVGVFGNVSFNYQRELYLTLTGRNDKSSTLIASNNSYFYPGTNASWVFTERLNGTHFKENVLNYGKVRFGVAGVGNDGIAYVNNNAGYLQSPINSGFGSIIPPFNGVPAYQIAGAFGDNNLKPERTTEIEIGTDLSFLKNKIDLSFTYYNKLTHDLISLVPTPPSSGFLANYVNVGDVSNRGVELSLRGTPISTRYGLKWDIFATYTHNRSNVESLNGGVDHIVLGGNGSSGTTTMSVVAATGHPFGTFYGADIQYWQNPNDGSWHAVVDPNTGLPLATPKPVYKGSFQPKFIASWGTEVTYKGLKLHCVFVTKQGGMFYSQNKLNLDFNGTSQETTINGRNPYVWENSVYNVPNTNIYLPNNTKFSPYTYYTTVEQQNLAAQGLVDASYVRLQELSLSYHIPQKYYQRSPFGGLEVGVFGNNLILWTAKSNKYEDPEMTTEGATGNVQGFNFTGRPSLRNYGGYLKVTF